MDHIINIIVRLFVFLSRFAPILAKTGLIEYRSFEDPGSLKKVGIDLDAEFDELAKEIPLSKDHQKRWSKPTTKLVDYTRCTNYGKCMLGCRTGAKWDSRVLLPESMGNPSIWTTLLIMSDTGSTFYKPLKIRKTYVSMVSSLYCEAYV